MKHILTVFYLTHDRTLNYHVCVWICFCTINFASKGKSNMKMVKLQKHIYAKT